MWKRNDNIKINSASELVAARSILISKPAPIIFSFNIPDSEVIYLINPVTFSAYDPIILQQATNIKTWQKIN